MFVDNFRTAVQVTGDEKITFLQGLLTQDMVAFSVPSAKYGCLLTPQGRFLHDMIIIYHENAILLFVETLRIDDFISILKKYRLRAQVNIEQTNKVLLRHLGDVHPSSGTWLPDPRSSDLGWVGFADDVQNIGTDENHEKIIYHEKRVLSLIPEGSMDMPVGDALIMDYGIDKYNGISFTKGCYMGQEVTARMHHRALIKKHLVVMKITGTTPPPQFTAVLDNAGKNVGITGHAVKVVQDTTINFLTLALVKNDAVLPVGLGNIDL